MMNWGSKLPIYNQTTLGPEILACGRLSFQLPRLGSHEAPDPELSAPCRCRTNMTELELVDGAQAQQDRVTSLAVILVTCVVCIIRKMELMRKAQGQSDWCQVWEPVLKSSYLVMLSLAADPHRQCAHALAAT